jgi:hypothetical protein
VCFSEISAVLAFVKFGSVKITALLFSAILSFTGYGFGGWVIKDLLATFHFALTTSAGRVEFCGNPFRIIGIIIGSHSVVCVWCVVEAGLNRLCGLGDLPSFMLANDLFLADLEPI